MLLLVASSENTSDGNNKIIIEGHAMRSKFGFILAPNSRLTGALEINRDIFSYLETKFAVKSITADTNYFYNVPVVGSLLNYFTNYNKSDEFEYVMGTSFATLPFLEKAKVIQHFHGVDTAGYHNVINSINSQTVGENLLMDKWLNEFRDIVIEDENAISCKLEIAKSVEKICAEKAEIIIVVAPATKKHVEKYFGINRDKIRVILNGIPDYWFENEADAENVNPNVVFTTRANRSAHTLLEKGHDRGYEILSKVQNNKNIFIYLNQMEERDERDYLTAVRRATDANIFRNNSRGEIKSKYQAYDIYLATSRTEACQLTLIEAMASKMVPITFPVGIAPDYIQDGVNGFIINSVEEGIDRINQLSNNHDMRKSLGEEAFKTAFDNFRYDQMLQKYFETIAEFI